MILIRMINKHVNYYVSVHESARNKCKNDVNTFIFLYANNAYKDIN
jgi:hypothetical protein